MDRYQIDSVGHEALEVNLSYRGEWVKWEDVKDLESQLASAEEDLKLIRVNLKGYPDSNLVSLSAVMGKNYFQMIDDLAEMQERLADQIENNLNLNGRVAKLTEEVERLREVIRSQDELLLAYRIGKKPTEKALDILLKYRKAEQALKEKE
jgi:hypothetical protein